MSLGSKINIKPTLKKSVANDMTFMCLLKRKNPNNDKTKERKKEGEKSKIYI